MCHDYWASKATLHVLNPFGGDPEIFPANMKLPKSARYNPMAGLDPTKPEVYPEVQKGWRIALLRTTGRTAMKRRRIFVTGLFRTIAGVIMVHICDLYSARASHADHTKKRYHQRKWGQFLGLRSGCERSVAPPTSGRS